ncbi:hypothetical protein FPV67DRAFT_1668126 [Lyophyllum atratum]|nr:hypothetical protein FPV67DRAFT_1668126 [Lyophyllum atratum]
MSSSESLTQVPRSSPAKRKTHPSPKRKAANEPSSSDSERPGPAKRARGIMPPTAPKKAKKDPYHMKKDEVPEDASGFKTALETHIRILLGAITNISVPETPDLHAINTFEQRFADARDVDKLLKGQTTFQNGNHAALQSLKDLRARCATDLTSNIVLAISRVPEHSLRQIFAAIHSFGLPSWRPDLLGGTPTSLYNGALEHIALWTFEQAASSFAYRHLAPNMRYLPDTSLIQKLYRNFLWSYMKDLVVKEQKEPGSLKRAVRDNKAYKSRTELTKRRNTWLKNNGWNERIQLLTDEVECTSDQESDPAGQGFLIMYKRARNSHVTNFFRTVDVSRKRGTPLFRGQRSNTRMELPRTAHPDNQESRISERLPILCPLDWFDPGYFNDMDIKFRALYVDAPIALPLHEHIVKDVMDWKAMPEDKFMEKYGNHVKAKYDLPTEEELRALDDDEQEERNEGGEGSGAGNQEEEENEGGEGNSNHQDQGDEHAPMNEG